MVKIDRLINKKEKEYILNVLENLKQKPWKINQEKLTIVIETLKFGIMKKNIFAKFILILDWLSYNKEIPEGRYSYNSLELIDSKMEEIHNRLEKQYNKYFGKSPDEYNKTS